MTSSLEIAVHQLMRFKIAPDPYAIEDDDIVMVDEPKVPVQKPPRDSRGKRKSKREVGILTSSLGLDMKHVSFYVFQFGRCNRSQKLTLTTLV